MSNQLNATSFFPSFIVSEKGHVNSLKHELEEVYLLTRKNNTSKKFECYLFFFFWKGSENVYIREKITKKIWNKMHLYHWSPWKRAQLPWRISFFFSFLFSYVPTRVVNIHSHYNIGFHDLKKKKKSWFFRGGKYLFFILLFFAGKVTQTHSQL